MFQQCEDGVFSDRPWDKRPDNFPKLKENPSLKSFKSQIERDNNIIDYESEASPVSLKKPSNHT